MSEYFLFICRNFSGMFQEFSSILTIVLQPSQVLNSKKYFLI